MPRTLQERAAYALARADRIPYDTSDAWYEVAAGFEEDEATNAPRQTGRSGPAGASSMNSRTTGAGRSRPRFIANV